MPEVIEVPVPEVIAEVTPPAPRRFEIPSFTDKAVEPPIIPGAPKADSPPATEVKPPEEPKVDPDAEKRKERQRVNRLYKQIAEEKAKRDLAEKQVLELTPKPKVSEGLPRMEDFTDVQEYAKAYAEHVKQAAIKDYEAAQANKANESQLRQLIEGWEAQTEVGAGKYEDFEQIVGELKPTTPWAIAIMQAENAADIAYYLGTHLDEAKKIVDLNPVSQIREIGKIEAKLLATPPTPAKVSKAPAPINPVAGAATVESKIEPGMQMEKFIKLRNKQLGR